MMLPDWVIPSVFIAIIGFFLRRYLLQQDKKYEALSSELRQQSDKFLSVVEELKNVIASLRVNSATQKTLQAERYRHTTEQFKRIDKDLDDHQKHTSEQFKRVDKEIIALKKGHEDNASKITQINERLKSYAYSISEKG